MAKVTALWQFTDGDVLKTTVSVESSYPDAIAEAVKSCFDLFNEALSLGLAYQSEDDD